MIVVDTSAWIEVLRGSVSPAGDALRRLLRERPGEIAITEVIAMELLAGEGSELEVDALRARLLSHEVLVLDGMGDYEDAASLYRACRGEGETIRRLTDCLIAVVAIRADAEVLHKDRDFDAIARHSDLRVYQV